MTHPSNSRLGMQYALPLNQRWCDGRASYRPPTEPIRTAEYEVAEIPDDTTARAFVTDSPLFAIISRRTFSDGTLPARRTRRRCGVFPSMLQCGFNKRSLTLQLFPLWSLAVVLLDSVAGNGETWFLARSFDILRDRSILGVVSFSDPQLRRTAAGEVVHLGHIGTIYQAHNGVYLGRGTARTLHLLPDGRVFSDRSAQKIRAGERGWRYAASQLESFGSRPVPTNEDDRSQWRAESLALVTTRIRHKGNHKYAWALNRAIKGQLLEVFPFQKLWIHFEMQFTLAHSINRPRQVEVPT